MAGSKTNRRYRARYLHRRGGRRQSAAAEDRGTARLLICGGIFIAIVLLKLLFPQAISAFAQAAGELIGRDADFKEAFAAIGRAVGGESEVGDSLQDAYTAVFQPESGVPAETADFYETGPEALWQWSGSQRFLRHVTPRMPETREIVKTAEEPEEDSVSTVALSYVYTMPALPENTSLEQRNLGFSYCSPLVGSLTSTFGWREHPVSGGTKFHYGIDLSGGMGEDILSFADGTVYATGESSTLGNYIMVRHKGEYMTLYAHCSKVTKLSGEVKMGEKIAEVGDSGMVTGPHLHFELHCGQLYLNPIYYVELASY